MPFISVSDEVAKKSFTQVENKFISKYLPVLEPMAVKVYLYALYIFQSGATFYNACDFAASLALSEEQITGYFEYLEEFELISIVSKSPLEIKILDAENVYGTPKKFKPEKYSDFTKSVQNIISGRMISTNEFREYFVLLDEYGFEQNALLMIINYCVNLKGADIRFQYIKKVAKSFADEGCITAKKVEQKLSAYTSATPALIKLFNAAGIKKQPDIDDEKLYKKWTDELGFEEAAIVCAAKNFKLKNCERLDAALEELFKNKKFDVKEIEDYCKNKNSVFVLTREIAKNLGVYIQDPAPYVENYVGIWCNCGYSFNCLKNLSVYCFKHGINTFNDMNAFINKLFNEGFVSDESVNEYLTKQNADEKLLKNLLTACGLTRKIIPWDRECLTKWRDWKFSDEMLFEAAKKTAGKSNPVAYMNGVLSSWKQDGIFTVDKTDNSNYAINKRNDVSAAPLRSEIERHYYDLRHAAEQRAEKTLEKAMSDNVYGAIYKELNDLNIQLAFAEIRDKENAKLISARIIELEKAGEERLKDLKIDKSDLTPKYYCSKCNDTGYDNQGNFCVCMKKFISTL